MALTLTCVPAVTPEGCARLRHPSASAATGFREVPGHDVGADFGFWSRSPRQRGADPVVSSPPSGSSSRDGLDASSIIVATVVLPSSAMS